MPAPWRPLRRSAAGAAGSEAEARRNRRSGTWWWDCPSAFPRSATGSSAKSMTTSRCERCHPYIREHYYSNPALQPPCAALFVGRIMPELVFCISMMRIRLYERPHLDVRDNRSPTHPEALTAAPTPTPPPLWRLQMYKDSAAKAGAGGGRAVNEEHGALFYTRPGSGPSATRASRDRTRPPSPRRRVLAGDSE